MSHNGSIDGFNSLVSLFPQENLGIVILTNCNSMASAILINSLAKEISDSLLGLKSKPRIGSALEQYRESQKNQADAKQKLEEERVKDTQLSHKIEDYVGVYENPGYGMMKVQLSDGQLSSVYNNIFIPLKHWHYDTFSRANGQLDDHVFKEVKFTFQTDSEGRIVALSVPIEPKINDIVFKRKADQQLSSPVFLKKLAGTYKSEEITVDVFVQGNHLSVIVPGQPQYDLIPDHGLSFKFKHFSWISFRFLVNDEGIVTELQFLQPNGIFSLMPVRSESEEPHKSLKN